MLNENELNTDLKLLKHLPIEELVKLYKQKFVINLSVGLNWLKKKLMYFYVCIIIYIDSGYKLFM